MSVHNLFFWSCTLIQYYTTKAFVLVVPQTEEPTAFCSHLVQSHGQNKSEKSGCCILYSVIKEPCQASEPFPS